MEYGFRKARAIIFPSPPPGIVPQVDFFPLYQGRAGEVLSTGSGQRQADFHPLVRCSHFVVIRVGKC